MIINGSLGTYDIIKTADGSFTAMSHHFDELCHSTSGAKEETQHIYVSGCQVIEKLQTKEKLCIFELGLGIGLGVQCTLDALREHNITKPVTFISTEIDHDFALWTLTESEFAKLYDLKKLELQKTRLSDATEAFKIKIGIHQLIVLVGDVRRTITDLDLICQETFDCVFQDAFSPRKNPKLWTVEWFAELYKRSSEDALLSTYSASITIRKGLQHAGFTVANGSGFGRKTSITICSKNKSLQDLELEAKLKHSKTEALRDYKD